MEREEGGEEEICAMSTLDGAICALSVTRQVPLASIPCKFGTLGSPAN